MVVLVVVSVVPIGWDRQDISNLFNSDSSAVVYINATTWEVDVVRSVPSDGGSPQILQSSIHASKIPFDVRLCNAKELKNSPPSFSQRPGRCYFVNSKIKTLTRVFRVACVRLDGCSI